MTNHDEYGSSAPTRVVPRPRTDSEPYGAWQWQQDGAPQPSSVDNPVVMRTLTEYRAAAWASAPAGPSGFEAAPPIERSRPSWFWPVVLTAAGLVALLGGGAGGFAIGHSIGIGTSQTQTTTPGTGTGGGTGTGTGGTGTFPGGGTGTGTGGGTGTFPGGGTGTFPGGGAGTGSGTSGTNS